MIDKESSALEEIWLPLLLADRSACLRWLVLRRLLARAADDSEVGELASLRQHDLLVTELTTQQMTDGSWPSGVGVGTGGVIQRTAQALMRLGYLGFDCELPAVARGASYLFSVQLDDGSWPMSLQEEKRDRHSKYDVIPLQTALPLRGLAACGYATHPDCERAYDWLIAQRVADGAWPTGYVSGSYGYVAGYRRLAHSRWGCRSNTTAALICLSQHPKRRYSPEAARGLDLLLGRESVEMQSMGFDLARTLGFEPTRGFFTYYGPFDLALMLKLCARIGATADDERLARIVSLVRGAQGAYGLWRHAGHLAASRWLTYDLLRSLNGLESLPEWISTEPRTPFSPYPARDRRH